MLDSRFSMLERSGSPPMAGWILDTLKIVNGDRRWCQKKLIRKARTRFTYDKSF